MYVHTYIYVNISIYKREEERERGREEPRRTNGLLSNRIGSESKDRIQR